MNMGVNESMEWKPIETAPTQEWILVTVKGSVLRVQFDKDWFDETGKIMALHKHFTHWMPLPIPPEKKRGCFNSVVQNRI